MKNKLFFLILVTAYSFYGISQVKIGDNPTVIDESAVLEIESDSQGFLPPRVADRDSLINPAKGLIVYDISRECLSSNIGTSSTPNWECIGSAPEVSETSGSDVKKIQTVGNYDSSLTVTNGPFEFRLIGSGTGGNEMAYQFRPIENPGGTVEVDVATIARWGGVGGAPTAFNNSYTFSGLNWETWQTISVVTGALNGHNAMVSVNSTNATNPIFNNLLFYNLIVQRIGGNTSGLKSFIIIRY